MTSYSDNAFAPGMVTDTFIPDQLIAGNLKLVTDTGLITGAALYKRGTVLGQITQGAVTSAAKAGGNTGTGTLTVPARLAHARLGTYQVRLTDATHFSVSDPDGDLIAQGVALGAFADQIGFTIAAGGTAFVAGDGFDVTVAAGSGSYTIATAAATDGSSVACAILVDDVDATAGDVNGGIYEMGEFNGNKLILGAGITLATAKAQLKRVGIFVKSVVTATDPTEA